MLVSKVKHIHNHFWKRESGLTSMLVLLCIENFILLPLFDNDLIIRIISNLLWMLLLFSGIISLAKKKSQLILLSSILFIHLIFGWLHFFNNNLSFRYIAFIIAIMVLLLFIFLVIKKVFEKGEVNLHRIVGSILVYLLIANLYAVIYSFMYHQDPGCFNVNFSSSEDNGVHCQFLYFSYTTLTTTGFGDIIPLHRFVRSLVVLEQVIGVLYPVILIGRLVSLRRENHGATDN
jgi:hypothetical protein